MPAKGRPRVTEESLRERIAGYCARYGVTEFNASGFPVFPAGRRETAQHREWVVLYKARSRLLGAAAPHRKELEPSALDREAVLKRQKGRCPVCAETVSSGDRYDDRGAGGPALVHRACGELARLAEPYGPEVLDRLRSYLWPGRR
jgi:hypothetical protein